MSKEKRAILTDMKRERGDTKDSIQFKFQIPKDFSLKKPGDFCALIDEIDFMQALGDACAVAIRKKYIKKP